MSAAPELVAPSKGEEKQFERVRLVRSKPKSEHSAAEDERVADASTRSTSPPADPIVVLPMHKVMQLLRASNPRHGADINTRASAARRVQETHGNRFVQRFMGAQVLQRKCACGGSCAKCQEEERRALQRSSAAAAPAEFGGIPTTHGEPLDATTRRPLEAHFRADLTDVRVHTSSEAAESATRLDALAYTSGRDIYFGAGMYSPASISGQRLLAHEVAHVVQQGSGKEPSIATKSARGVKIGAPDDMLETEADQAAEQFMSGTPGELTDEEQRKRRGSITPVQRLVQRQQPTAPPAPGPAPDKPSGALPLEQIASDLAVDVPYLQNRRESIFRNLLRAGKQKDELTRLYKEKSPNKSDLTADLQWPNVDRAWLRGDSIRALRYLEYGELRPSDKIFLAAQGAMAWTTVERLLPEVNRNFIGIEQEFARDYNTDYPDKSPLPNGQSSHVAALLDSKFSESEAVKGKAIVAFGSPEPLDLIRAGAEAASVLVSLQQARQAFASVKALREAYQARYPTPPNRLFDLHIEKTLDGDDLARAKLILNDNYDLSHRLKIATGTGLWPDEKEIWAALQEAKPDEIAELRNEFKEQKGPLYEMLKGGLITGLSKDSLTRVEAMIGAGPEGEDPAVTKVKAQGGVNGAGIVNAIKTAVNPDWKLYCEQYTGATPLGKYADGLLTNNERGFVLSYLQQKVIDRIKFGLDHLDLEYVTLQITVFASEEDKKVILDDTGAMGKVDAFSASAANKIRDLLIPANLTPAKKAEYLNAKIKRETSGVGSGTAAADALADEQRELDLALEQSKADPAQKDKLDAAIKRTEQALSVYIAVRDELAAYVQIAVDLAMSLAVTVATAGAGTAALAAAVARAALATAVMSVSVQKIIRGDNFEVLSPEAAGVFISGFVSGASGVAAAPIAEAGVAKALGDAARVAAQETGGVAFVSSGRTILTRAAEGAIGGSPGSMVDTAVKDETWKDGFVTGLGNVFVAGAQGAATGAGTGVALHAISDSLKIPGPEGEEHELVFREDGALERCSPACPIHQQNLEDRLDRLNSLEPDFVKNLKNMKDRVKDIRSRSKALAKEFDKVNRLPEAERTPRRLELRQESAALDAEVVSLEKVDQFLKRLRQQEMPLTDRELGPEAIIMFREAFGAENVASGLRDKETIASYLALREATAGLERAYQAHHIVEGQILRLLGFDENLCPAVILNEKEHVAVTALLKKTILDPTHISNNDVTKKEILEGYREAYKDHPRWLALVEDYLK